MPPEAPSVEQVEVLVVGAGVAGLACARALRDAGVRPVVLDRARGVGGRCATRRVDGIPIDHGVVFAHGDDPQFLAALDELPAPRLDGWPRRILGRGAPCQPLAFQPGEQRLAFADGMSALPKHLARDLDVRLGQDALGVALRRDAIEVITHRGTVWRARTVVIALALEQARLLLDGVGTTEEVSAVLRLLSILTTVPCLTALVGYRPRKGEPAWDVAYPEDSPVLQLVCHDSAKRRSSPFTTLVLQARPGWSRRHLEVAPARWAAEMLAEAARLFGPWASAPSWMQTHRWRHARLDAGNQLAAPVLLDLADGVRLGLAGELFAPSGGLQAAYVSGLRVAERLVAKGGW